MKVLHLDDHQLFTEGLRAVLERAWPDCQVTCCTSVGDALKLMADDTNWDLMLADLQMPGLDGLAFLQALGERDLLVPVIVMSAVEDPFVVRQAFDRGAQGFIPKSYSTEAIVDAINRFMEEGLFVPPELAEQIEQLPDNAPASQRERQMHRYQLTERQMEVLALMRDGYANREIGRILHISENTVKTHLKVLFQALAASSRLECVREAERVGLLALTDQPLHRQA